MTIQTEQAAKVQDMVPRFFSEEGFQKLKNIMHLQRAAARTFLFWEGDCSNNLYYIRSGRIKLTKTTEDGKGLILSILQQGDLLGEINGSCDSYYSYSAEVIEPAEIGFIPQKDLELLIYQDAKLALSFIRWTDAKQKIMQSKLRDLLLFGKSGALASTLIRMANRFGVRCPDGIRIELSLNHTEIAELIGSTRENVNRMLNSLKEDGTIMINHGQITILCIEKLRQTCHCPQYPACSKEICCL